jgi:hypothetical protein
MDDAEVGWLGVSMTLSGCMGAVLLGMLMDRFTGRLKTGIVILDALSTVGFAFFALATSGWLNLSHSGLVQLVYAAGILGGLSLNASIPLYFELALESVFGFASETAATSLMILLNTAVQIIFLAIPTKIGGTAAWMNWLMLAICVLSIGPIFMFKAEYQRSEVDAAHADTVGVADAAAAGPRQAKRLARGLDGFGCI